MMRRWLSAFLPLLLASMMVPEPVAALDDAIGYALFQRAWVPAPSSTKANAGLGPLFNARSCSACHRELEREAVRTDENGIVQSDQLVLRFSDRAGNPDPVYGRQLQTSAVAGLEPEGSIRLRNGRFEPHGLNYGPISGDTRIGALLAPALRGLGQIESIPDSALAAAEAENAKRSDGVRGRVNWVRDGQGQRRAGRFGWKAATANLDEQVQTAFMLDLGLSTPGRSSVAGDCTGAQVLCLSAPHGGREGFPEEITTEIVARVAAYLRVIGRASPAVSSSRGERLFTSVGCAACHRPSMPGSTGPVRAYSDFLLHDMGLGLDGGATEAGVAPTEWRTAPLWGLSATLAKGAGFLHDGRARTIPDAIRHHAGEAAMSRSRFEALTRAEQRALVDFLKQL